MSTTSNGPRNRNNAVDYFSEESSLHFGPSIRRKLKLEAHVTSGCGKHKEKLKIIDTFWEKVWPELEKLGWTKVYGTGRQEGSVHFIPKGVDCSTAIKGVDYYDRIRSTLDRILERRNPAEAAIADIYTNNIETSPAKKRKRRSQRQFDVSRSRQAPVAIDLSWKEGNKGFPKKTSIVGEKYQVTDIPSAGTYEAEGNLNSDNYCELVWDPKRASEKGIKLDTTADDVIAGLPHNKKEAAMLLLGERDYELQGFKEACEKIVPGDGSGWSQEKKDVFHSEIFRLRKDFPSICSELNIDMKTCLAYYLGTFKTSDEYRLVKTVCAEERMERMENAEFDEDACAVCGAGGSLLICDGCEGEYHMECMQPPLASVPEGRWECDQCIDTKFLDTWEYLARNTGMFEKKKGGKRTFEEADEVGASAESDDDEIPTQANESVIRAMRTFAKKVNAVLSIPDQNQSIDKGDAALSESKNDSGCSEPTEVPDTKANDPRHKQNKLDTTLSYVPSNERNYSGPEEKAAEPTRGCGWLAGAPSGPEEEAAGQITKPTATMDSIRADSAIIDLTLSNDEDNGIRRMSC